MYMYIHFDNLHDYVTIFWSYLDSNRDFRTRFRESITNPEVDLIGIPLGNPCAGKISVWVFDNFSLKEQEEETIKHIRGAQVYLLTARMWVVVQIIGTAVYVRHTRLRIVRSLPVAARTISSQKVARRKRQERKYSFSNQSRQIKTLMRLDINLNAWKLI